MRSRKHYNVFSPEFLEERKKREEAGAAAEAAFAGPWRVVKRGSERFAVIHAALDDDGPEEAVFTSRETALLVAGLYPVLGRDNPYYFSDDAGEPRAAVCRAAGGRELLIGRLRYRHVELLEALHVAEYFLSSPEALAGLLGAASYDVAVRAGKLLAARLHHGEGEAS